MTKKPRRNRLRFTLRGLFAIVTVAAIGCAALANPTELWASVVFSGTLALLVVALLVAVARRGSVRASAIGFALCGCAYLGLILAPGSETNIAPNLVTSKVLVELEAWWRSPPVEEYMGNALARFLSQPRPTWSGSPFHRISHSLWALLFAIVGSVVARWLWTGGQSQ